MDEMRNNPTKCHHCLSDCDHVTYLPTITSSEFRCFIQNCVSTVLTCSFRSSCDSRNLNLSPLCNLSSTTLAKWQPGVLETYGNLKTDYVSNISGPLRNKYLGSMNEEELITSLTKAIETLYLQNWNQNHILSIRTGFPTMPMKKTLPLWTSSLGSRLYLVS